MRLPPLPARLTMAKKDKKLYDDDDGRTIADMNVDGLPWYQRNKPDRKIEDEDKPTRKEFWAMVRAGFAAYAPRILAVLVGFGIAIGLVICWLNGWFVK